MVSNKLFKKKNSIPKEEEIHLNEVSDLSHKWMAVIKHCIVGGDPFRELL